MWKWYNKVDTKLRDFCFCCSKRIRNTSKYVVSNEYEEHGESAFPRRETALYSYQFEIKKLKKENLELKRN